MKLNELGGQKPSVAESLEVGKAHKAMFLACSRHKRRNFDSSALSAEETLISASIVPHSEGVGADEESQNVYTPTVRVWVQMRRARTCISPQ